MRHLTIVVIGGLLSGCLSGSPTRPDGATQAERIAELESQMQRLENRVESGQMLELMQRVESMQAEMRELRGDVERTGHEIESMNRRQRELYLDLDRRLQNLEGGGRAPAHATPQAENAPVTQGSDTSRDEQRVRYESAFRLLQEGRYPASINAFQQYLDEFPEGEYADNAQYWLGEAYYVTREYVAAGAEFRKLLDNFPRSQKVPDAMLKIGYVHYELRQWDDARAVLAAVRERVPNTTISRLADQRLQRMRQEGR